MNKSLFLSIFLIFLLIGCSTIKDGFQSQRKNSTDEFLVEKKLPLVMPPNYKNLPLPEGSKQIDNVKDFQQLIDKDKINVSEIQDENFSQKNTTKFILDKIKSN